MIQYSQEKYRASLMKMWKICFHDSDAFIRFYFSEVYKDDEMLIFMENDEPIAALQIIPFPLKSGEKIYSAGYISGAMTHPDHRRKGLMAALLQIAFEEMVKKGISLSFLIPQEEWLFGFYEKFGYQKAFPKAEILLSPDKFPDQSGSEIQVFEDIQSIDVSQIYKEYIRLLSLNTSVVLKTEKQFEILLKDFFLDKGKILISSKPSGIAFIFHRRKKVIIKELLYADEKARTDLLYTIHIRFNPEKSILYSRKMNQNQPLTGMIKLFDPEIHSEITPENIYMSMMMD